jgi:hypothetical protein
MRACRGGVGSGRGCSRRGWTGVRAETKGKVGQRGAAREGISWSGWDRRNAGGREMRGAFEGVV